jgi:hypothetical protein
MTDQVHVHKAWVSMQPVLPQEIWGKRERGKKKQTNKQTCVAKQPNLFQEIVKKPKICVPVQPLLPQKILKKPKTCVHMQLVLPHEILQKP